MSIIAISAMAAFWLLTLISLWNSVLTGNVRNEGWVVVFAILEFLTGLILFWIAYVSADDSKIENVRKTAYESGKNEILAEIERKKQAEITRKMEEEKISGTVSLILSSVQACRSLNSLCSKLMNALAKEIGLVQGVIYIKNAQEESFLPVSEYAITDRKPQPFKEGENLAGQVALSKQSMTIYDIPENYFIVASGLGTAQPRYLLITPVLANDQVLAILELALFIKPDQNTEKILELVFAELGPKFQKFTTD